MCARFADNYGSNRLSHQTWDQGAETILDIKRCQPSGAIDQAIGQVRLVSLIYGRGTRVPRRATQVDPQNLVSRFTFAVPMRDVYLVGYTPHAWDPRSLQSMLNRPLYFFCYKLMTIIIIIKRCHCIRALLYH